MSIQHSTFNILHSTLKNKDMEIKVMFNIKYTDE